MEAAALAATMAAYEGKMAATMAQVVKAVTGWRGVVVHTVKVVRLAVAAAGVEEVRDGASAVAEEDLQEEMKLPPS